MMSVYCMSIMVTSGMLLFVFPMLSVVIIMLFVDCFWNTCLFDPVFGGDVVYYQHLFWYFGHPEVYILIIPGFGLVSLVIGCFTNVMACAVFCIAGLGMIVWGHHIYT